MPETRENAHYNENYFAYQRQIGEFGGWANLTKFSDYITPEDRVLEFGAGGDIFCAKFSAKANWE